MQQPSDNNAQNVPSCSSTSVPKKSINRKRKEVPPCDDFAKTKMDMLADDETNYAQMQRVMTETLLELQKKASEQSDVNNSNVGQ